VACKRHGRNKDLHLPELSTRKLSRLGREKASVGEKIELFSIALLGGSGL
jgi:hypothetical protein